MNRTADEALYDWISARELRLSAARTLTGFSCEYAERGSGNADDPGVPRCYLSGVDESEWCGGCRQRNRLFPGLKPLRKVEHRAFRRLCRVASRLKRAHDQRKSSSSSSAGRGPTNDRDADEKYAFDNGSGMTEVMTVPEMIAEIQRLGLRCVELFEARAPTSGTVGARAFLDRVEMFVRTVLQNRQDVGIGTRNAADAILDALPKQRASLVPEGAATDVRAIVERLGFDPTNHHNALACPYCNPNRLTLAAQPPADSKECIRQHQAPGPAPAPQETTTTD